MLSLALVSNRAGAETGEAQRAGHVTRPPRQANWRGKRPLPPPPGSLRLLSLALVSDRAGAETGETKGVGHVTRPPSQVNWCSKRPLPGPRGLSGCCLWLVSPTGRGRRPERPIGPATSLDRQV